MEKKEIKIVGLDLDGTLLTDKKELLPYTKNVTRTGKVLEEHLLSKEAAKKQLRSEENMTLCWKFILMGRDMLRKMRSRR